MANSQQLLRITVFLWMSCWVVSSATGFARPTLILLHRNHYHQQQQPSSLQLQQSSVWKVPRGGDDDEYQQEYDDESSAPTVSVSDETSTTTTTASKPTPTASTAKATAASVPIVSKLVSLFALIGKTYSYRLEAQPIITKSVTAGVIFGLSDYLAQSIESSSSSDKSKSKGSSFDWTRMISSTLVGLLYFGPAAHYWYEWIFQLLPSTSLVSTINKAILGQLIFGPSFTCIFFAVSLLQSGNFSIKTWFQKIKSDLPGAWLAGVGYWPIIDFISYSVIPIKLIPLFVNMASLIWTVYLSMVANKGKGE
jgi:protein Mpv17